MVSITEFRSQVLRYGSFAKSSKFEIMIAPANQFLLGWSDFLRDVPLLASSAELPGTAFEESSARYYGPDFKFPTKRVYTPMTIGFMIQDDMSTKNFFDAWHDYADGGPGDYDIRYKEEYVTSVNVIQFDEYGVPTYQVTLNKAWPASVMAIPLNWGDETFTRLTVQFDYKNFQQRGL